MSIYMEIPDIMSQHFNIFQEYHFIKLRRALYGLRQSSREWNLLLVQTLKVLGLLN